MKWLSVLLVFFVCSCASNKDSGGINNRPTFAHSVYVDYSVIGRRSLNINPVIWTDSDLRNPTVACEKFGSANVALIRVRYLITNSNKIAAIENEMFQSDKYLILSDQLKSDSENQRRIAAGLMRDAEAYVKYKVSAIVEDALSNGVNSIGTSGFNYILLADAYSDSFNSCPNLFSLESKLIHYIDNVQHI